MYKRYVDANAAFLNLFSYVRSQGVQVKNTKAVFNTMFTLIFPSSNTIEVPWRKWKPDYAELEWQWYLTGNRNPEMVEQRAKIWGQIKDDQGYVNSNYGNWWLRNNQLDRMLSMLKEDPFTRKAILVHYNPDEVQDYSKDTPCNVVLNFYRENPNTKDLCMTVFARSIDLVFGFCNDQYCFSKLHELVADKLGLSIGTCTYMITNLHIYDRHIFMDQRF